MKRLVAFIILSMTSVANAEVSPSDVAAALEARYGPLSANTSLAVSVNSVGPYTGKLTPPENGLPEHFLAVIWDQKSNRFAVLVEDKSGTPMRIAGVTVLETKIPALKTRLNIGDIISKNDIEYINIQNNASLQSVVQSSEILIGKEVTRLITPGRPVPTDNIAAPTVVKRNQEVQIIFKKGGLELISKGKALSNAAIGDTVKITRKDAARTLEGIAVSEGVVEINSGVTK